MRRYAPLMRRYLAARWRLPAESERVTEACHEVVVQLFKEQGALQRASRDRSGGFRAFLYGVVRNVALMTERSSRNPRQVHLESCLDPQAIEQSDARLSRVFNRAWIEMIASQARERLAARCFEQSPSDRRRAAYRCLELRYVEGLAPRQMVDRLQRDVTEIYELLRLARGEYRTAVLAVMAEHYPHRSRVELEELCKELIRL